MRRLRWIGLMQMVLVISAFLPGCQRGPLPLSSVQGKVSYKGAPVRGGTIVFTPDGARGEKGRIAHSKIEADGTYLLTTGELKGASPGRYRVTIVSLAHTNPPTTTDRFLAPLSLLPEKYRDPDQSDLACEVKANRSNILDFDLP